MQNAAGKKPQIGIFALQGCVEPHVPHLEALGCAVVRVRKAKDLQGIDGLIIPGGESTTFLKLISIFGLENPLIQSAHEIPFWGICAGAILMAEKVIEPAQASLKLIDIDIERNAYGRQLESFYFPLKGNLVAFIRAPRIVRYGKDVEVLESLKGNPVCAIQGRHMVSTFHPELNPDTPSSFHRIFVEKVKAQLRHRSVADLKNLSS